MHFTPFYLRPVKNTKQSKCKRLSFTLHLSVKMTAMGEMSLRKATEDVPLLDVAEMSVGVSQTGIMVSLNKTGNEY
jgi:hypothetical protein